MKYEKDFEKVSFGFGNEKVAGKGDLSQNIDGKQELASDSTAIVTIVIQAIIAAAALIFKVKFSPKKSRKKAKKKNKR